MDRYNGASLSISEFRDKFFVLSEEAIAELRAGDTVFLQDVEFQGQYPVPQSANVNSSLLFNVISMEAAQELGENCFKEDGEFHIKWADLADADLGTPTYTEWSNSLLPKNKVPVEGQTVDLVLEMDHTADGEEVLNVRDFRPRNEDAEIDMSSQISTPKGISEEDQEESDEEETTEEPTEEPR